MRREKSAQLKLTKAKNAQPSQRTTTKNRFNFMNVGKVGCSANITIMSKCSLE